jgi:hypothetical protein
MIAKSIGEEPLAEEFSPRRERSMAAQRARSPTRYPTVKSTLNVL